MRIFAPINTSAEAETLIKAGADELFCGIVPKEWQEKYSNAFSVNRRHLPVNQLLGVSELEQIVKAAKASNVNVFVALNNLFYPAEQKTSLIEYMRQMESIGVDGVIIANIPLIEMCIGNTNLNVSISGEALPINSESVKMYKEMGVSRITFPRDITLNEMARIISTNSDLEYEAFILRERCAYCGGNCFVSHGITKTNWCGEPWERRLMPLDEEMVHYDQYNSFRKTEGMYKVWKSMDHLDSMNRINNDIRLSECGLCGLQKMREMGVLSLKIVGRGIPTEDKVAHIELLKQALEACDPMGDHEDFTRKMRELKATPGYCESKAKCYYRDFDEV